MCAETVQGSQNGQ